jgi:transaldolase/glucose-6-phosphate isomerase
MNPLKALGELGQSPWLDFMRRNLIGPELDKLIEEDGLGGITSNPSIFEKAIGHSADYDGQFAHLVAASDQSPMALYEAMAIDDIQHAADRLTPIHERTGLRDGFISLEVSPYLAKDTKATIVEARRLWHRVNKPNLMVKVPATPEGIPAIETLIGEGININVTLLFAQDAYVHVAEAYIRGLERLHRDGGDLSRVASVASFFVSRIDALIDGEIDARLKASPDDPERQTLLALKGKVAVANARLAYQHYKRIFGSERFQLLAEQGAQEQRLLWASTGTKNPSYPDTLYVATLIGRNTVNTMPPATMDAFRDHGVAALTIEEDLKGAEATMAALGKVGISMEEVTGKLVEDGVQLFADAFDALLGAVEKKRTDFLGARLNQATAQLPPALAEAVAAETKRWGKHGLIRRLYAGDATLWTGRDEAKWLGWLDIAQRELADHAKLDVLRAAASRYAHVLLLGMGGSSLGPVVLASVFGALPNRPILHVLDSTDPVQIKAFEDKISVTETLFIVSSKSGSTLEPNILRDYFFDLLAASVGAKAAADRFVAVTDPGSGLQKSAEKAGFGHIFFGDPAIGGRYSVLSPFGLVPGAAMGIDIPGFLETTALMQHSCGPDVPPTHNPGVQLGLILGAAGMAGRDKVTILAGPGLEDFGTWAEQLIAESTGKQGKGLIPVAAEAAGDVGVYGSDRIFVHLGFADRPDPAAGKVAALTAAGYPVVGITLSEPADLGQEFFRWEVAIAVAGSLLGIDPFDQPDVEDAKIATRKLTDVYDQGGAPPAAEPFFEGAGMKLFADPSNARELANAAEKSLVGYLAAHFARLQPGDYAAFLAFIPQEPATVEALQAIRLLIRDRKRVATCVGFGPRFLHSTGQAYKGGPNSGVFLQITCDDATDFAVPGHKYSFGQVKAAQAAGDFQVLAERGRRALRVHLGKDPAAGLTALAKAIDAALG